MAPIAIAAAAIIYAIAIMWIASPFKQIDYSILALEVSESVIALLGMFLLTGLRKNAYTAYLLLISGLGCLSIAMITDALKEAYYLDRTVILVTEGFFQVAGISFIIYGLYKWIGWNTSQIAMLGQLATTDALTTLANRRKFFEVFDNHKEQINRNYYDLSVALLDIDDFKKINDIYGHQEGDRILKLVADVARKNVRKTDLAARYGGEEFIFLFPNTSLENCAVIAEKIRAEIEKIETGYDTKLTASMGAAQFDKDEDTDHCVKRADHALYDAKNSGKNCVVLAASATDSYQQGSL